MVVKSVTRKHKNVVARIFGAFYLASTIFYLFWRIRDTIVEMGPRQQGYSWFFLAVEVFGMMALLPYAFLNLSHVLPAKEPRHATYDQFFGEALSKQYHVFIIVPCYKESWKTIQRTLKQAHEARIPPGCTKHIILADDGWNLTTPGHNNRKDGLKKLQRQLFKKYRDLKRENSDLPDRPEWFYTLHHSNRFKKVNEVPMEGNGKSLNVNYCIQYIIPKILKQMDDLKRSSLVSHASLTDSSSPRRRAASMASQFKCRWPESNAWHESSVPTLTEEQKRNSFVVVLDADMAIKTESNEYLRWSEPPSSNGSAGFLPKAIRALHTDESLDLVLFPQSFTNQDPNADVFNHINAQFWEYILPGLNRWGYVACTGTNVCMRLSALLEIPTPGQRHAQMVQAPFPTYTLTEDYALSLILKKMGKKGTYIAEYLVEGEAPQGIALIDQQRQRWTEGHWQAFFSRNNPFFCWKLYPLQAFLYNYGTLAYLANVITTWVYLIVPLLSVFKINPVYFSPGFRGAVTFYIFSTFLVQYYVKTGEHVASMWRANMSNVLLSCTYLTAIIMSVGHRTKFKSSGDQENEDIEADADGIYAPDTADATLPEKSLTKTPFNKIWWHWLYFIIMATVSLVTIVAAIIQMGIRKRFSSTYVLPMAWSIYNLAGPILFFFSACLNRTSSLSMACVILQEVQKAAGLVAVAAVWFVGTKLKCGNE